MITLVTAVDKQLHTSDVFVPKGTEGQVLDIIIEGGKVLFLLDFADYGTYEWYEPPEVEEKC